MSRLGRALACAGVLVIGPGCARPVTPAVSREVFVVESDAPGDAAHPADVQLLIRHGALHVRPDAAAAHLVAGAIRTRDATLFPHVTANTRGVAVVQDFSDDAPGAPKIFWDLALGNTPMRLDVHSLNSEEQHVDLGGCRIVAARIYNEGGSLDLDWSAANALEADDLELWSIGELDVKHLARARAKRIEVKNIGFGVLDLGERIESPVHIDVLASQGTLVLVVPPGTPAHVFFDPPTSAVHVDLEAWRQEAPGAYTLGASESARTVDVVVHAAGGVIQLRTSRPIAK